MGTLRSVVKLVLLALAFAACGGSDFPIRDDDDGTDGGGDDAPDASSGDPDANPDLPDAGPDALGNGAAPDIEIVSPTPGGLLAGVMTLVVEVTDADGIDDVTATIAGIHTIPMSPVTATRWSGTFDTEVLAGLVFPTIVVRARDFSAEESQLGFQITLDNEAPIASLDPPRVRESRVVDGELLCSTSFDPVGGDAPDDGEGVAQLIELRARVLDLPNTGTSTSTVYVPMAGIATADLYVLDDTARPLIVDSDGDGQCDALNPEIQPTTVPTTSTEAAVIELATVPSGGSASFPPGTTYAGSNAAVCTPGTETTQQSDLCVTADATRAIATPFEHQAEIYAIPPVTALSCMGYAFDARASNISDGWACVAVVTTDVLGNTRVSPVTRVCIDSDHDQGDGCPDWGEIAGAGARPDCTGTLTGAVVTTTACTAPVTFSDSGVADDYELIRNDF
jgi:hypothetical protein